MSLEHNETVRFESAPNTLDADKCVRAPCTPLLVNIRTGPPQADLGLSRACVTNFKIDQLICACK
jgi:hypothetical protein